MKNIKVLTVSLDEILSNISILMSMKDYRKEIILDSYCRLLEYKLEDEDILNFAKECVSWQYDGCDTVESISKPLFIFKENMALEKIRKK